MTILAGWMTVLLSSTLVSAAASAASIPLGRRLGRVSAGGELRAGPGGVPVMGGLAVVSGLAAGCLTGRLAAPGVWGASSWPFHPGAAGLVLLVAGFWMIGWADDRRPLSPALRLGLEVPLAAAAAIAVAGPSWRGALPLALGAVAGANAFNMIDNSDGLAAGVGAISCAALAFAGAGAPLFLAASGALAGFWIFNHPPARLYLGDHGTLPMGGLIGVGLARLSSQTERIVSEPLACAVALLAAGYLLADPLHTLAFRVLEGRRPWAGGVDHLSHDLARAARGWPPALAAILLVQACSAAVAVLLARGRAPSAAAWASLCTWGLLLLACARLRGRPRPPAAGREARRA